MFVGAGGLLGKQHMQSAVPIDDQVTLVLAIKPFRHFADQAPAATQITNHEELRGPKARLDVSKLDINGLVDFA